MTQAVGRPFRLLGPDLCRLSYVLISPLVTLSRSSFYRVSCRASGDLEARNRKAFTWKDGDLIFYSPKSR